MFKDQVVEEALAKVIEIKKQPESQEGSRSRQGWLTVSEAAENWNKMKHENCLLHLAIDNQFLVWW